MFDFKWKANSKKRGELKLVQIARMMQKKGHLYTVQAFVEAFKHCPNMMGLS